MPVVSPAAAEVARSVGRIMRTTNRLKARMATEGQRGEWTAFHLLTALAEFGPLRLSQLAERSHIDPSTLSRQVAILVDDGLIERQVDPHDGRASTVACSEAGTSFLAKKRSHRDEFIAGVMQDWTEADRSHLAELLERFSASLDERLSCAADTLETEIS
ncbi:MAG: MarR family winged helix-turn-helix transcriptional regulator [Mycobacteriales bacterium]